MQGGHIVESGTMDDIFRKPRELYTQKLIAAIPRCEKKTKNRIKEG